MATKLSPAPPTRAERATVTRQCPYCGSLVSRNIRQCPHCRETMPELHEVRAAATGDKRAQIRKGLLCMLLAAVVHFFAGGYSALNLPFPIAPLVTIYLSPLLFLSGLGLIVFSFFSSKK